MTPMTPRDVRILPTENEQKLLLFIQLGDIQSNSQHIYLHFSNKISTMRIQMHSNQQFADIQDMTSQASECRSGRGVEVDQGIRTIWIRKMSMNPIVLIYLGRLRVYSRDDSLHLICRSSRIVAMAYQMQALEIQRKIKLKTKNFLNTC